MVLLDDKYIIVRYEATNHSIYYKWKGFIPNDVLKNTLEKVVAWSKKYNAITLISNLENMGVVSKENQEWVATEFVSSLIQLGMKNFAIILPTSIFGKLSNDEVIKKNPSINVITQNFDNEQKAFEWAKEIQRQQVGKS